MPHPMMWWLHLAFGPPFGRRGCRIVLPDGARTVEGAGGHDDGPQLSTLAAAAVEGEPTSVSYLTGFTTGRYRVLAPGGGPGLEVARDAALLPYLWRWREAGASAGFPWHGRAHTFGLEPFSSQPNAGLAAAVANVSALGFLPGQSRALEWSVCALGAGEAVDDEGRRSPTESEVHPVDAGQRAQPSPSTGSADTPTSPESAVVRRAQAGHALSHLWRPPRRGRESASSPRRLPA